MPAPTLDGHNAVAQHPAATTITITLTTTLPNDIIVVCLYNENTTNPIRTITGVSAPGLTFTQRSSVSTTNVNNANLGTWWALASSALSAVTITVTISGGTDDYVLIAFGVNGCNTAAPWDTNTSLPKSTVLNANPSTVSGVSTTQSNNFVFGVLGTVLNAQPTTPTSFTKIDGASTNVASRSAGASAWYEQFVSPQTNLSVSSSNNGSGQIMIVDALTADGVLNAPIMLAHL